MKIWMLSHTYLPAVGGIENYLREVGKVLLKKGHQPIVICRRHLSDLPEEETIEGIRVIRHPDFPVPRSKLFSKHLYLAEQIAAWLRGSPYGREGWALCRYPHYQFALSSLADCCPSIYLPASVWPALAPLSTSAGSLKERFFELWWRRQVSFLEKESLQRASRVAVFSRNMIDQLKNLYGIEPKTVIINPPGVDTDRFHPGPPDPVLLRSLNLPPETPLVLFLGRLSPEKNLIFLVRSLSPLLRENRAILIIAGEGPMKLAIERESKKLGCSDSIRLVGSTEGPQKFYAIADIFVSPSRYESFGQSILEAMASGLPVVALKSSPPRIMTAAEEIIEEGASGYAIPEDGAALREKIEALLNSPPLREAMGRKGREICLERFTWEDHVSGLLNEF
jgi:glycosyltransferase involved in cell wall biosynthesis